MTRSMQLLLGFALTMLTLALVFGCVAAFAFLYPEFYNRFLPFYQLRPMHVSAAIFWIITGASAGVLYFKKEVFHYKETIWDRAFIYTWIATVIAIFAFYGVKRFGGREYWEFPPLLCLPILAAWLCMLWGYFKAWMKRAKNPPLYVWMWSTGIIFFLITFLEQNLYQISWFRQSFLREVTVQWKSNGAMVGAWNQMIYGTSMYIMTRLLSSDSIARSRRAYTFYFIGLTNLMLNWGHHIYNLPTTSFIRHVAYAVSMTEWIVFIAICIDFKNKLQETIKWKHLLTHRLLISAEYWAYLNLALAITMSIPAVNRYTHGTHITVAHAMGATIGINTMILLSSLGYILKIDTLPEKYRRSIKLGFLVSHISLFIFWAALLAAGILKGYRSTAIHMGNFQEMMQPVLKVLHVSAFSGIALLAGMLMVVVPYFNALLRAGKRAPIPAVSFKELNPAGLEKFSKEKTIVP